MRREAYNNSWHNQGQSHKEVLKKIRRLKVVKADFKCRPDLYHLPIPAQIYIDVSWRWVFAAQS
jgi:hypothetical protein